MKKEPQFVFGVYLVDGKYQNHMNENFSFLKQEYLDQITDEITKCNERIVVILKSKETVRELMK